MTNGHWSTTNSHWSTTKRLPLYRLTLIVNEYFILIASPATATQAEAYTVIDGS